MARSTWPPAPRSGGKVVRSGVAADDVLRRREHLPGRRAARGAVDEEKRRAADEDLGRRADGVRRRWVGGYGCIGGAKNIERWDPWIGDER
jgi:hypothetical protein